MSLVSIQNLGKTFIGDSVTYTALEEIDLQIGDEEFYCLLGPSGCGKTTILNGVFVRTGGVRFFNRA